MRIDKITMQIRIIIIFLVMAVISLTTISTIYWLLWNKEYKNISNSTQYQRNVFCDMITNDLAILNSLASDTYITKGDFTSEDIQSKVNLVVEKTGMSLCIVNKFGVGYDSNGTDINLSKMMDLEELFAYKNGIIEPEINSSLRGDAIYFYAEIMGEDDEKYRLIALYSKKNMHEMYAIDSIENGGITYIVDQNGDLVLSPDDIIYPNWKNLNGLVNVSQRSNTLLKKNTSSQDIYYIGSEKNIISTYPLYMNNWYVVSVTPKLLLYKNLDIMIYRFVILFCFICIGMLIAIYYFVKLSKKNSYLIMNSASNQAKNKFLSDISHEIRTPMNAILGMSEIARYSINDKKKLEECLVNIENTSEYLLSLINDILDMSKIESNKLELHIEPFKIFSVIDTVKSVSLSKVNLKNINMSIIKSGDLDEIVCGDQSRLNQILVNIITNAVKFTGENGKIRFSISGEKISDKTVKYLFEITDSGIGIKKENYAKIFDAFEQGESNITSIYGGSGLGLAICKGYLQLMGGEISVDSEYGKRTTFYVELELPIATCDEKEKFTCCMENAKKKRDIQDAGRENRSRHIVDCEISSEICEDVSAEIKEKIETDKEIKNKDINNKEDLPKRQVLLVDDNEINLEVTSTMLKFYGYRVVIAHNGQEAIEVFDDSILFEFDAILMDIQMPIKNGLEATMEIRKLNRNDAQSVKIIALTANAFRDDIEIALKAGMNMHISKPIKMQKLKDKLDELFLVG